VEFPLGWGARIGTDLLFHDAGLRRQIAVEVADIPNIIDLVNAGFGFAFLGPSMVPNPRKVVLRTVRPAPRFSVSLITSSERPHTAAARAFIGLIAKTYPSPTRRTPPP
jgi:DNA-binding transcriptional LysR family regulator